MRFLTVVTPCYNEEQNVERVFNEVRTVFESHSDCEYRHLFIDNASKDNTPAILQHLAMKNKQVQVIFNVKNFGALKSMHHGLLQATGEAVILIFADMQDPPEVIHKFIESWKLGYKAVVGVKISSDESPLLYAMRTVYYRLLREISEVKTINHFNGFGLYDRDVIEVLRSINDQMPYFRGLIAELGFGFIEIPYHQRKREKGKTKSNLFHLYDVAMLGLTSHSRLPLRIATIAGFVLALLSGFVGFGYFIAKLLYWNSFPLGIAPLIVGFFFVSSVQLFFIGLLGEYIGAIYAQVRIRPLVIERARLNFTSTEFITKETCTMRGSGE